MRSQIGIQLIQHSDSSAIKSVFLGRSNVFVTVYVTLPKTKHANHMLEQATYSNTYLKRPLKKLTKNWLARPIIAYCRSKVLQNAPSLSAPLVIKTLVLSIFEWPLKTDLTVIRVLLSVGAA